MSDASPRPGFAHLAPAVRLSLLLLAVLLVALSAMLWPHWRSNPDLSHGFFMPIIFLLLLREARQGAPRYLRDSAGLTAALAVGLILGLLALSAGGLYAASLGWSHDLVAFTLTGAGVLLLLASLAVLASAPVRWLPCNWTALVAAGLWLLSAPLPPGTYSRLTLGLQLMVSENVLRTLHLLGIAAVREGNIIQLATAAVGIEEACSGVRSLVSCVFAGVFFSGMLVQRPWSRAVLILLSAPLALAMNFARSLALTLLANAGVHVAGAWHDFTGFAVLGLTAALLAGLAYLLERPAPVVSRPAADSAEALPVAASALARRLLAGALGAAVVLTGAFALATRPAERADAPVPDLAALLPATAVGWRVETATDLSQFRGILQTDHLAQRLYTHPTRQGPAVVIVYLAYWRPGQASVSLVASHTPDACWPGAGWEALPVPQQRARLAVGSRLLPDAEQRAFRSDAFLQNVWYWHLYDGHPLLHEDPHSPRELLRLAWRYGFRREGDQLFVRISSNLPWDQIRHEPFIEQLFARLQPLGL